MILYFTQKEQDKQCFKFWPKIQTICHSNVCCDILLLQPFWTNILDLVKKNSVFCNTKENSPHFCKFKSNLLYNHGAVYF